MYSTTVKQNTTSMLDVIRNKFNPPPSSSKKIEDYVQKPKPVISDSKGEGDFISLDNAEQPIKLQTLPQVNNPETPETPILDSLENVDEIVQGYHDIENADDLMMDTEQKAEVNKTVRPRGAHTKPKHCSLFGIPKSDDVSEQKPDSNTSSWFKYLFYAGALGIGISFLKK